MCIFLGSLEQPGCANTSTVCIDDGCLLEIYVSLQSCSVKNNSLRLKTLLNATTSKSLKNRLGALLTILLLDFRVAEELYADLVQIPLTYRQYDIHIRFKEDLVNPIHGLRCLNKTA